MSTRPGRESGGGESRSRRLASLSPVTKLRSRQVRGGQVQVRRADAPSHEQPCSESSRIPGSRTTSHVNCRFATAVQSITSFTISNRLKQ